jgi:hypothetical protein
MALVTERLLQMAGRIPAQEFYVEAEYDREDELTGALVGIRVVNSLGRSVEVTLRRPNGQDWKSVVVPDGTDSTFRASGPVSRLEHIDWLSAREV